MKEGPDITHAAALIGEPARANMLVALMSGKALTATELACEAGITLQTASAHLGKLREGGMLVMRRQGRHRYFALASSEVASALETLMGLAARSGHLRTRTGPADTALRNARVCYNHLAGDLGVQMFESLTARGLLEVTPSGLGISQRGTPFFETLGIDLAALQRSRGTVCRECLDWSERRSHLAGSLGRALFSRVETLGWARRDTTSRAVLFTPQGLDQFHSTFPPYRG
ncbi:ArsR/SmtB family transcription factor [Pelagibacterium mangrovi]|uniref:ArsR/SmtB family transcription factor n=1 Tax=Pelagibacterium mangrovi TaxID=3119828 RepID=UPI002FC722E6